MFASIGQAFPVGLVVGGGTVYWTQWVQSDGGSYSSTLVSGAEDGVPTPLATIMGQSRGVALGGSNVYVTVLAPSGSMNGSVVQIPAAGGAATMLVSGPFIPSGVATDATNVYWTESPTSSPQSNGSVMAMPMAGGNSMTLTSGQHSPTSIATDGTNVYFTTGGSSSVPGALMKVPVGGGAV